MSDMYSPCTLINQKFFLVQLPQSTSMLLLTFINSWRNGWFVVADFSQNCSGLHGGSISHDHKFPTSCKGSTLCFGKSIVPSHFLFKNIWINVMRTHEVLKTGIYRQHWCIKKRHGVKTTENLISTRVWNDKMTCRWWIKTKLAVTIRECYVCSNQRPNINKFCKHNLNTNGDAKETAFSSWEDSTNYYSFKSSYLGAGRNKNEVRWELSRNSTPRKIHSRGENLTLLLARNHIFKFTTLPIWFKIFSNHLFIRKKKSHFP